MSSRTFLSGEGEGSGSALTLVLPLVSGCGPVYLTTSLPLSLEDLWLSRCLDLDLSPPNILENRPPFFEEESLLDLSLALSLHLPLPLSSTERPATLRTVCSYSSPESLSYVFLGREGPSSSGSVSAS
jgi:hypothetical protein